MRFFDEFRRRFRSVIWPAIGVCAVAYFAYHMVNGNRGLVAWHALQQQVETARAEAAAVRLERQAIEHRVGLLNPKSVDRDMLDEWSRRVLGYGRADEIVIPLDARQAAARPGR